MTADTAPLWDGVPLNPEEDGWHAIQMTFFSGTSERKMERHYYWSTSEQRWWLPTGALDWLKMPSSFFGAKGYAPAYPPQYLGPCLTPSEVAAREAAAFAAGAKAMRGIVVSRHGVEAFLAGFYGSKASFTGSIRDGLEEIRALPIPPMPTQGGNADE